MAHDRLDRHRVLGVIANRLERSAKIVEGSFAVQLVGKLPELGGDWRTT